MSRQELLANIPIFESLTPDDLQSLVSRLEEISYAQDEVIFNQGDEGSSLFIVEDGAVDISYGEGRRRRRSSLRGWSGSIAMISPTSSTRIRRRR